MKRDFMKFEDKLKLNNKAIGKNCEKIYNLNATFDLRLYEVETNCNKLLTTSLKLQGKITKLTSRFNYLLGVVILKKNVLAYASSIRP